MAASLQNLQSGSWYQAMVLLAKCERNEPVRIAPKDQTRNIDAVQPFRQIRVVTARLPRQLGRHKSVLHQGRRFLLRRRIGISLFSKLWICENNFGELPRIHEKDVGSRDAFDMNSHRRCERHGLQAIRAANSHLGGDPSAERISYQMNFSQLHRFQEIEVEICHVADCLDPVRCIGGSETGMVGRDDVELFRQEIHERRGNIRPVCTVKKKQGCPSSTSSNEQLTAIHRDMILSKLHIVELLMKGKL